MQMNKKRHSSESLLTHYKAVWSLINNVPTHSNMIRHINYRMFIFLSIKLKTLNRFENRTLLA